MNRAFKIAKAPNQEQSELGVGVSNSRQVYIRVGNDFTVELDPEQAVRTAESIMRAAQIAVARSAASDAAWKG